jgi:hypothetical protein
VRQSRNPEACQIKETAMAPAGNDDVFPPDLDPQMRASLKYALDKVFGGNPARIDAWLYAPDRLFDGRSPLAAIEAGEAMRVLRALASHDSRIIDR